MGGEKGGEPTVGMYCLKEHFFFLKRKESNKKRRVGKMTVSFQGIVFIRLNFKMCAINFSCLFLYIHSCQCAATCSPCGGAVVQLTLNFFLTRLFNIHVQSCFSP